VNKRAVTKVGASIQIGEDPRAKRVARRPIKIANLIGLAVEQLAHHEKFPLTRIGATSFGKLFERIPIPVLLIDRSLRIAFANNACRKMSLASPIVGRPASNVFPDENMANGFDSLMQKVYGNRKTLVAELTIRLGSNELTGRVHFRALTLGKQRAILAIFQDVVHEEQEASASPQREEKILKARTELHRLNSLLTLEAASPEEVLQKPRIEVRKFNGPTDAKEGHADFRHAQPNASHDATVICDGQGRILYMDDSFTQLFGSTLRSIEGQEMACTQESNGKILLSQMLECVANNEAGQLETETHGKDGNLVDVRVGSSRFADQAGRPTGMVPFLRKVVQDKRVEEAVSRSEEITQALLNASRDAVALLNTAGVVLTSNEIFAGRFGLPMEQLVGKNLLDFFPEPLAKERLERAKDVLSTGVPVVFSDQRAGLHMENTVCPLFDREGRVARLAIVSRDVTDQARTVAELKSAKKEAEVANRAKSEFLANVSHELRTPLNAIIGFSEILEDQLFGELNEKQLAHVGHVLSSGRELLQLIDHVLDLANVEIGQMELRIAGVNVRQVLESSLVMINERAAKQGLTTQLSVSDELGDMRIEADQAKLKQIVFNLLSNAAKFTPAGGKIQVDAEKDGDHVVVRVADTGIGLKPEDQDRVFHAFEQVDSSPARRHSGTGLGLALTKKMVELHGGRIWVESRGEGYGSTFVFAIPVFSPAPQVSTMEDCARPRHITE